MVTGSSPQVYDEDVAKRLSKTRFALMEVNELVAEANSWLPTNHATHRLLSRVLQLVSHVLGETELPKPVG